MAPPTSTCRLTSLVPPACDSSHLRHHRLTYWVVYAAFNILESFSDYLLYWIPFYYAVKLGFLVWLFYPSTQGAKFLYDHVLREILQRGEHHIDKALNHASKASADVADVAAKAVPGAASEADGKKSQ